MGTVRTPDKLSHRKERILIRGLVMTPQDSFCLCLSHVKFANIGIAKVYNAFVRASFYRLFFITIDNYSEVLETKQNLLCVSCLMHLDAPAPLLQLL